MQLIELNEGQGGKQWHVHRAEHWNASECAAMLGVSPYMTRDELLRQKKIGIAPEVSEYQQRIFDRVLGSKHALMAC